jgi:hypothetical protein
MAVAAGAGGQGPGVGEDSPKTNSPLSSNHEFLLA